MIVKICNMQAQTDTLFWFAAPEVSQSHADRPILLRISTMDRGSSVSISQPANPAFTPVIVNIAANASKTVDLTNNIDIIENKPANTILNYGLLVKSSNLITVYYEEASVLNPELFVLKGKNALGTEFLTPFQNFWDNAVYSPILPFSSFDIVATEDNTIVNITPKNDIVGHPADVTFSITLNKGQTYSATASSQLAAKHLGGSRISSDKPIAVSIKDDSMKNKLGIGKDLQGDQIVPVNIIGKEYIVMKGLLFDMDKIFIMAVENNTNIFINGGLTPVATLNKGETYPYDITKNLTYINTSEPTYVIHYTGLGDEIGGTILPTIKCTGSRQVSFTRVFQTFSINLMTKAGNQGNFVLNGKPALIQESAFSPVPGTSGTWVAAQISFNTTDIPIGVASLISNSSGAFHLGVITGSGDGCEYGYFSDYAGALNFPDEQTICLGDTLTFDAGFKDKYLWSNGSNGEKLHVSQEGLYWIETEKYGCSLTDSFLVKMDKVPVTITGATSICKGQEVSMVASGALRYLWSTSETTASIKVSPPSTKDYYLTVFSSQCSNIDTVRIIVHEYPLASAGADEAICSGTKTQLHATGGNSYSWRPSLYMSDSSIANPDIDPAKTIQYTVRVGKDNCFVESSVLITVKEMPKPFAGKDETICQGNSTQLNASGGDSYLWRPSQQMNEPSVSNPVIHPAITTMYIVRVGLDNCFSEDSINVIVSPNLSIKNGEIPNIFTPNGDGNNDVYKIDLDGNIEKFNLRIYNRWGMELFSTSSINDYWDGNFNGQKVAAGTYFYLLEAQGGCTGQGIKKQGEITVGY